MEGTKDLGLPPPGIHSRDISDLKDLRISGVHSRPLSLSLPFRWWLLPKIVWKLFSGHSSSWLESVDYPVPPKAGSCFPDHLLMITCSFHSSCCWLSSCHTNLITSQIKNLIAYQTGSVLELSDSLQASLTHYSHLASRCSSHLWTGVPLSLPAGWVKTASAISHKMGLISDRTAKGLLWETDEIMLWKPFENRRAL